MISYMASTLRCENKESIVSYKNVSQIATVMQGYTMTKNKHFTSLKAAVELRSPVFNLKITGHALPAKVTLKNL